MKKAFTIGIDFGTNSVRALVADCTNGKEAGSSVYDYPSGEQGILLDRKDHNLARQNPADYITGLEASVKSALRKAAAYKGFSQANIIGIGVDTTGSTPIPVDSVNRPLAFDKKWKKNPAAHAWLWKDHTGAEEAAAITVLAREHRPHYLSKIGGIYSSEWFWSKIVRCLKVAPDVFKTAYSWIELADFIPSVLCGVTDPIQVKRGICAAGHKALYCDEWGGLPDKEFLAKLHPALASLRDRLYAKAFDAKTRAGTLSSEWAVRLGLQRGIPVAIGMLDAHSGAVGAGIAEGVLVKIIGTSACDCFVAPRSRNLPDIPGICGIVDGSILPGYYGIEAGQSAVGDIFKWFVERICKGNAKLHDELTKEASRLRPGQSGLLSLDWNNGNRTILVDPRLSGLLLGQTLYTSRAEIYRALIEATAFGARAIIERVKQSGVPVNDIICCGGIAEKNPLLMQIYADVTGCTMKISGSSQTCALGSALAAACTAGAKVGGYDSFEKAQKAMCSVRAVSFRPEPKAVKVYNELYALYRKVHDGFGGLANQSDYTDIMKKIIAIKEQQSR